jgi:endonuclease-3 related protein
VIIYEKLFAAYGKQHWWPAKGPFEMMVGAILTQNTAWTNVEKALHNFGTRLSSQLILDIDKQSLIDIIRPAGFFNQKANHALIVHHAKLHCNTNPRCNGCPICSNCISKLV